MSSSETIAVPKSAKAMSVPLSKIRPSPVALRSVNKQDQQYKELCDSIRKRGVLQSILLRELVDKETGETIYGLVDGLQRYNCSLDCGFDEINASVVSEMADSEVLINQIVTNAIRVETKPGEFTKQLVRIFQADPLLTLDAMAERLNRSPGWVQDRLGLKDLSDRILKLIDDGKIPLSNAYALAKLPEEELSEEWVKQAIADSPSEFVLAANDRAKELREAARQGRKPSTSTFNPMKHFQKMPDVDQEIIAKDAGRALISTLGPNPDALEVWALALQWVLHQDPKSLEAAKAKHEAKQAALQAERDKRKKDREDAKNKEAGDLAASAVNTPAAAPASAPAAETANVI